MKPVHSLQHIRRGAALLVAAVLAIAASWTSNPAASQAAAPSVRIVVDFGDGTTKTIDGLPWAKGNTVFDAMKAATARAHGISFSYTGTAATAVLTKIDDTQNEGPGKKNWQYRVNQTSGDRSFAVYELQAQDVVLWRFAAQQRP